MWIAKPNKTIISPNLIEATNRNLKIVLSGVHELNFSLPLYVDKKMQLIANPNTKKIREKFTVKLKLGKFEEWMVIDKITRNMGSDEYSVVCYSLAYQLKYKRLQDYAVDAASIDSVLTDVLAQTGWTVGYIDTELLDKYRSFDVSSTNKLDFMNEIAEKYGAILIYDNPNRKVNFYSPGNVGTDKGLRFLYGKYLESLDYEENYGEVYTHLRVTGADNITIHRYNPTGLGYLIDYSHYLYPFDRDEDRNVIKSSYYMDDDLSHAVMDYVTKIDSRKNDFNNYLTQLNSLQTQLTFKENEKSELTTQLNVILDSIAVKQEIEQDTAALVVQQTNKNNEISVKQTEINVIKTQIETVSDNIEALKFDLSYEENFTEPQLQELILNYIQEGEISESNISDELELYEYGLEQLEKKRSPEINLTVGIVNFLQCLSEQRNWDKLVIGDKVTVNNQRLKVDVKANIDSIEYDFDNGEIQVEIKDIQKKDNDETRYFKKLLKFAETEKTQKVEKAKLSKLTYNFNSRNDRISTPPANPIIANNGTAVDHIQNDDGSVDISFEWSFNPNNLETDEYNIDGFVIYLRTLTTNGEYTFGSSVAKEDRREVSGDKRAIQVCGVPANKFYTFGIQTYRRVDEDIISTGILTSNIVKSVHPSENPYLPSETVPFYGDLLGTINGENVDASRIEDWDNAEANANHYTDITANAKLEEIASDSKFTPVEKQLIKKDWDIIVAEKPVIESQATTYGMTAEKTNFVSAYDALNTYITPLLASLITTSDIIGATFRTKFKDYYDKKAVLLKAISDSTYDYSTSPNINLIQNGGAEICTGKFGVGIPDGWMTSQPSNLCTFNRRVSDTSWTIAGTASFEISAGSLTTNTNGYYYQDFLNPVVGKSYTLSAKFGTHRCNGYISISFLNSSGTVISTISSSKNNDPSTTDVRKITAVCPINSVKIRVQIVKDNTTAGQPTSYIFADSIKLEEGTKATPYIETGNSDAINNAVQQGKKYNNTEINSLDGFKAWHNDGSVSKLNGDGLEVRGGNVTVYDDSNRLVMDGRGLNPLENSGWGITTGLTFNISSFVRGSYVEPKYIGPDIASGVINSTLQLDSVAGLAPTGTLYLPGRWLGNSITYDTVNATNNTIRATSTFIALSSGSYLWNTNPSGTVTLLVKAGTAILKNGKYINIGNDVSLTVPIASSVSDVDGYQYRVIYLNSLGNVAYMSSGTSGGISDEWSIDVYPDNPRNSVDANAVILGTILCGGNHTAKKAFGAYVIMHPDFRDERAVKVTEKISTGGKYSANIQKSILATSSAYYGSWSNSAIALVSGQSYTIALPIGQGKRAAILSVASTANLYDMDDSPNYGATIFLGLKDPCNNVAQPKMSIGYNNYFVDSHHIDSNGKYIVHQNSMGWSYRRIRDSWLEIGADGEVYLKVELYQPITSETRALRLNWICW